MTLPEQSVLIHNEVLPYKGPGDPYLCSMSEVEDVFLFSDRRKTLWQIFQLWKDRCQAVFGECRFLVNGSFVTSKPDPHDIDVAFLVNQDVYDISPPEIIYTLTTNFQILSRRKVRIQPFGGMLDAFPIRCEDAERATFESPVPRYWDDLWSRVNKDKHYLKTGAVRKGYLEVRQ